MTIKSPEQVIAGLGKTGFACAKFLWERQIPFAITDTRENPPFLQQFCQQFPDVITKVGGLDQELLVNAKEIIVSPGLSLKEPQLAAAVDAGVAIIGDIELFVRLAKAPICAITGSNGKSTVTALVAAMAKAANVDVRMGGNFGTPALDLLQEKEPELYVLELSSFQLETTYSLRALAATILNISPDHMDRYDNLSDYINAKQRIYNNAEFAIINRDDLATIPAHSSYSQTINFGLSPAKNGEFGLIKENNETFLSYGSEKLLSVTEMQLQGTHNWANALAALALGFAVKLPLTAMLTTLKQFSGLAHRCQRVGIKNGVTWYNDSKGTNVGASLSALEGIGSAISGKIILIAGGLAKNADFTAFTQVAKKYVSHAILIGQDAPFIAKALQHQVEYTHTKTLIDAIKLAATKAKAGDCVLLSPACASFDMFENFEDRGEAFMRAVRELIL